MATTLQRDVRRIQDFGSNSPALDTVPLAWLVGDVRLNTDANGTVNALNYGIIEWVCTVAGQPGTWVAVYGAGSAPISLTNRSIVISGGGSILTEDNPNFIIDNVNHRMVIALGGTYTPATGAPLTISGLGTGSPRAILLDSSSAQTIVKINNSFGIGTVDANLFFIEVNAIARAIWQSSGTFAGTTAAVAGGAIGWQMTPGSHTLLAAEFNDFYFNCANTATLNGGASIATMRNVHIFPRTYSAASAATITTAATLAIDFAPAASTNVTITQPLALWILNGDSRFGGNVIVDSLAGGTSAIVKASTTGVLQRAVAGTDYVAPWSLTSPSIVVSAGGSALTEDNGNFVIDVSNHRMVLGTAGTYTPAAGPLLTLAGGNFSLSNAGGQSIDKTGGGLNITFPSGQQFGIIQNTTGAGMLVQSAGNLVFTNPTMTGAATTTAFHFVAGNWTTAPASAEVLQFQVDLSGTFQRATGAVVQQRAVFIQGPTYTFAGASTITTAATVAIENTPVAGTNCTITQALALWVMAGDVRFGGGAIVDGLAGVGNRMVGVSSTGRLQIATVGTDYPSPLATYWVSSSTNAPTNAVNIGALATGILSVSVTGGVATPSTQTLTSTTVLFATSSTVIGGDANNFVWDNTNKRLVVGLSGAYTPTAGSALVVGGAATGSVTISLPSAVNQGVIKTNGALLVGTGDANTLQLTTNAVARASWDSNGALTLASSNTTAGVTTLTFNPGSGSSMAGEVIDASFSMAGTVNLAAGATISTMRNMHLFPRTYTATSARTITTAATLEINFAPAASTNVTITQPLAIWVPSGDVRFQSNIINDPLGGASSVLVKASTTGVLQRGVPGTDYAVSVVAGTNITVSNSSGNWTVNVSGGVVPSLTAGSVIFSGGGTTLSQDNVNFYWDDANNRLWLLNGSAPSLASGAPLNIMSSSAGNTAIAFGQASQAQWITKSGGGSVRLQTSTADSLELATNSTARATWDSNGSLTLANTQPAAGAVGVMFSPGSATAMNTEIRDFYFSMSGTVSLSAGATIATMRNVDMFPRTYTAPSARTITTAATLSINFAPAASTNVTITQPLAIWVVSGDSRFAGNIIGDTLAGGTAVVVKASTTGVLQRGVPGTDYAVSLVAGTNITVSNSSGNWTVNATSSGGITQLTGDGTAGPGSGSQVFTLVNIPNDTTAAGDILFTDIASPGTPATGKARLYVDSTTQNLCLKNAAGFIQHGVQTQAVIAHSFMQAVSDSGTWTVTQPTIADISGGIPGRLKSFQIFTTATAGTTYTRPAGITAVLVEVVGAGGGGAGTAAAGAGQAVVGAGGGGGGYAMGYYPAMTATGTIIVGAGGTGGAASAGSAAGNGGNSSFTDGTNIIQGNGGSGAVGSVASGTTTVIQVGGAGGYVLVGSTVVKKIAGGTGGMCIRSSGTTGASQQNMCGGGGMSGMAAGGATGNTVTGAGTSPNPGGGGGSGSIGLNGAAAGTGGAGGVGMVIVWEFTNS